MKTNTTQVKKMLFLLPGSGDSFGCPTGSFYPLASAVQGEHLHLKKNEHNFKVVI